MNSLWKETARPEHFKTLKGDTKTDVLIIGGGMAGILCAYMLKNAGVDCTLAEAENIGGGVTGNTTAKITVQHGFIYSKLVKEFSVETAQMYLKANAEALERYKQLCGEIDCDFEEKSSFVYTADDKSKAEEELNALHKIGFGAKYAEKLSIPVKTSGGVEFTGQAQFHPLKFIYAISKNLPVFENTKVTELVPGGAVTRYGRIKAKKIIVATHFPFINKHGSFFLKLYQHRSYVIALEGADVTDGMYVDEDLKGLSFRSHNDLLLLGGGSHRTGKNGGNWRELESFARLKYPKAKIKYRWATQDCMSLDSVPYIGLYSRNTPDMYVATGFNKWGMTSAMVSATLLTDMILGKQNPYEKLFSPQRSIIRPQLAVNGIESAINLLTPTAPRCPHLGCALKYNTAEHSWDCPCHGSRFTEKGDLLNNPATDGIEIKRNN